MFDAVTYVMVTLVVLMIVIVMVVLFAMMVLLVYSYIAIVYFIMFVLFVQLGTSLDYFFVHRAFSCCDCIRVLWDGLRDIVY